MFTKEEYRLLKASKKEKKDVIVQIKKGKSFKGKIAELTPWYVNIRRDNEKKKQLNPSHK